MPAPALDYASPSQTHHPAGPILFKPSRLAVLLALATAATAAWLAARHHPWTPTARVHCPRSRGAPPTLRFVPGAGLMTADDVVRLWHPQTGQQLQIFGDPVAPNSAAHATADGTRVLCKLNDTVTLRDTRTRQVLQTVTLGRPDQEIIALDATARRWLSRDARPTNFVPDPTRHVNLWVLERAAPSTRPIEPTHSFLGQDAAISPDGKRIAVSIARDPVRAGIAPWYELNVYDADTGRRAFSLLEGPYSATFNPDATRITLHQQFSRGARYAKMIDAETGVEIKDPLRLGGADRVASTLDGHVAAALIRGGGLASVRAVGRATDGTPLGAPTTRPVDGTIRHDVLDFFPDSRRVLAPGPDAESIAVYAAPALRPLAILRDQAQRIVAAGISPNGRYLALFAEDDHLTFYKRTGPDCPESALGALAFPHVLLLAVLVTALALTLRRDACRAAYADLPPAIAALSLALLLITLPRTLRALIGLCIGEPLLTPAPILLLAAIALATGSKTNRLATIALLATTLPFELLALHDLRQSGLDAATPTLLFDRTYAVPHRAAFILLAATTTLIPIALYLLARPQPRKP